MLFDWIVPSLVAGSSVEQSAVWFISQPRSHDWDQPPTGAFTPGSFSGTGFIKASRLKSCKKCIMSIKFGLCVFNAQIPMLSNKPHGYIEVTRETAAIPSLADVLWVYEDEGESFAKSRYRQFFLQ